MSEGGNPQELSFDVDPPYVAFAVLCDRILEDKDGTLSLIRMVDKITVTPAGDVPPDPQFVYEIWLGIGFRVPPDYHGKHTLRIRQLDPLGLERNLQPTPIEFQGKGVNMRAQLVLQLGGPGLYFLEVFIDQRPMTRIPFTVEFTDPEPGGSEAEPEVEISPQPAEEP